MYTASKKTIPIIREYFAVKTQIRSIHKTAEELETKIKPFIFISRTNRIALENRLKRLIRHEIAQFHADTSRKTFFQTPLDHPKFV